MIFWTGGYLVSKFKGPEVYQIKSSHPIWTAGPHSKPMGPPLGT